MEYWGELPVSSNAVPLSAGDIQHILECTRKHKEAEYEYETEDEKHRRFVLYRGLKSSSDQQQLTLNIYQVQPYWHMMELSEYVRKMDGVIERLRKRKQSQDEINSQSVGLTLSSSSIYRRQRQVFIVDEPPLMTAESNEEQNQLSDLSKDILNEQICYEIGKRAVSTILCCYGFSDCTSEVLATVVDLLHDWMLAACGDIAKLLATSADYNVLSVFDVLGGLPQLDDFYTLHVPSLHANLIESASQMYQEAVKITVDDPTLTVE